MKAKLLVSATYAMLLAMALMFALTSAPPAQACYKACVEIQCTLTPGDPTGWLTITSFDSPTFAFTTGSFNCRPNGYRNLLVSATCEEWPCAFSSRTDGAPGKLYLGESNDRIAELTVTEKQASEIRDFVGKLADQDDTAAKVLGKFNTLPTRHLTLEEFHDRHGKKSS